MTKIPQNMSFELSSQEEPRKVTTMNETLPSKTMRLTMVTDSSGSYPQLTFGDAVIDTTTAVELVSDSPRGQSMRGEMNVSWDSSIGTVAVEGWSIDAKNRTATGTYSASADVMQQDTAFTLQCTLSGGAKPATKTTAGWVGPNAQGVWTLDPYVQLRRTDFKVSQIV